MSQEILIERLFDALTSGDRAASTTIVAETLSQGASPHRVITDLFWPTYQQISTFHRNDQLTTLSHHLATRLLRVLVDQTSAKLERLHAVHRTVFAICGPTDSDELAAQMAIDLLDAAGFTIQFAGGGVAMDEILAKVQQTQPDHLLIFASAPTDLPAIRALIDRLNEIGVCSPSDNTLQIVVGGGVFNRAEGLAQEIGADLWAATPGELEQAMIDDPHRRAADDQRTVGRNRSRRSKRSAA